MSTQPPNRPGGARATAGQVAPPDLARTDGLGGVTPLDEDTEKRIDEIEMIGEEEAAGLTAPGHSEVTAGMRYLHSSRTIHQLVTDRNRAVGLYVAVASLLWTASSALLNARPDQLGHLIVPITAVQRWCQPVTFGTLAVLAFFVAFLLIRTRIGLLYEVAKMNLLLGLPVGRVRRISPLSIFFIMHTLISVAGGAAGGLFAFWLLYDPNAASHAREGTTAALIGLGITLALLLLYVGTVLYTTSEKKLQGT
jgi:hypothetical protein